MADIKKLTGDRTKLIDNIIAALEKTVSGSQAELLKFVVSDIVDKMETEDGRIKNSPYNRRLFSAVDSVFSDYAKKSGLAVAKSIIEGVTKIVDFNSDYFSALADPVKLGKIAPQVIDDVGQWLGITKGKIEPNGYLNTLINDTGTKEEIKNVVIKSVVSQAGYNETRQAVALYIGGNEEQAGALQKYHRNFVYDTFSQIDRTAQKLFADKLNFNYAIYEGGLVKKSRKFCIDRNGKVFTREEISRFDPTEARPPGYNSFVDLGGYGCRHHLNWVPDAVAFALRPELRGMKPVEPPRVEAPAKKKAPAPKKAAPTKPAPTAPVKPAGKFEGTKEKVLNDLTEAFNNNSRFNVRRVEAHPDLTPEKISLYSKKVNELLNDYDQPIFVDGSKPAVSFYSKGNNYGEVSSYNDGARIIDINFGHRTDPGRGKPDRAILYERYAGMTARKFATKSKTDPENNEFATIVHEFAHVISTSRQTNWAYLDDRIGPFWLEMSSIKRKYNKEIKKYNQFVNGESEAVFKEKTERLNELYLGDYANTNLNEFMAEGFTEYKLNSKPSKYAKLIGELIDKTFKKKN